MSDKFNIDQVAELARLSLKPEERSKLVKDLEAILAYVDQLQKLDTQSVPPTSHPLALANVSRSDAAISSEVAEAVLRHAPKREGQYFKVPKVIED